MLASLTGNHYLDTSQRILQMKHTLLLFCSIPFVLSANHIQAQANRDSPVVVFERARMDSLFDLLEQRHKIMGTINLAKGGKTIYSRTIGYRSISQGDSLPNDTATRFRIGCISKIFTATMIFQLIEEGKLSLQTPLSDFFPTLPNAPKITVGHLMSHRSGLFNVTEDSSFLQSSYQPTTETQLLERIGHYPPLFEPGTQAGYSNTNFILLGMIVEKLTGQSYAEALEQRITRKIGLSHTSVGGLIDPAKDEAHSYLRWGNTWKPVRETDLSAALGVGSLISTPSDINRFLNALFHNELIHDSSLQTMTYIKDGFGMGIQPSSMESLLSYGDMGGMDSFNSMTGYLPDDDVALTMLTNADDYDTYQIEQAVLKIYFHKPYKLIRFHPFYTQLPVAGLGKYEGIYSSKQFPLDIKIIVDQGVLTAQAAGQNVFPLSAISWKEFHADQSGIEIDFVLEPGGTVTGFTLEQFPNTFVYTRK